MVTESQRNAFYEGCRTPDLPLAVNDVVIVTTGQKRGLTASVVSLETPPPNPNYLIEFSDGSSTIVPFAQLKLIHCLFSRTIQNGDNEYFVGIYDETDTVSIVVSERSGGDAAISLVRDDVDQIIAALRRWQSNR